MKNNVSTQSRKLAYSKTDERNIHQEMADYRNELEKNPKEARDFLVSARIMTAKGNLRKVFGG
jgi:hypothetical protein